MDDLIVIILTLIIAVIGALGQIKKKKRPQAENQNEVQEPGNFWDLFEQEQEYSVDQQEEMIKHEVQEPLLTEEEKVESTARQYEFTAENEGRSIYGKDIKKIQEQKEEEVKVKKKLRDFSLKKAVIYSEILNRKYT